jgi:N-acetylneuraminic acid mutarotase
MDELKERFAEADRMIGRDHWHDIAGRAVSPEVSPRALEWPPTLRRRAVAAFVALAVFVGAAMFAWDLSHPDLVPMPRPPADPAVDLAAELAPGWTELPPPPEVRTAAATAWTGTQLLVWGGYVFDGSGNKSPFDDGFAFDAASRTWSRIPDSPLSWRSDAASAWTGEELLIWGGWSGECCVPSEMFLDDGAAFDPATGRWRRLADAPIGERAPFSTWTGEELIVWGSTGRELYLQDGAAYDPSTDSWRPIAEAPLELSDATTVWTGEEMIVFGSSLDGNNRSETPTAIGVAYDPDTDTWRELASSPLSPQAHTAGWPGRGEMIAWDYEHGTAAYDPSTDTWRRLDDVPLRFSECYPQSATVPEHVFGNFCGQLVLYSAFDDSWTEITRKDLRGWLIEPAPAGNAFLVSAHSLELSDQPNVTFDTRMLAYVPPRPDASGNIRESAPFVPATKATSDTVRMPVVFPDGTRATLVYPIPLDLATLGVQPEVSYLWKDDPPPRYPIMFLHDPHASIAKYVRGADPVGSIEAQGVIDIWQMSDEWEDRRRLLQGHWLRYALPSWTVLVAMERPDDAEEVAASLTIEETKTGFPVVATSGPIALSQESGEGEGPMLHIGSVGDTAVLLWLERCSFEAGVDEVLESGAYGSACLAGGRVTAEIYGVPSVVEEISHGLSIDDFGSTSPG